MTEGRRGYRSPLRAEQARQTRAAVLDAAARCFLERGYAATTMKDVAAAAGVAVQTVFAQGGKAALLLACVDRTLVGDDEQAPVLARDQFVRLREAPGRAEKLAAYREIALRYAPRIWPIMATFAAAAAADPEIAAAWAEYGRRRYVDMRALVDSFASWLRPALDADRATDILWAVLDHHPAEALLGERGWTGEEYADWLVDTVERLLLR